MLCLRRRSTNGWQWQLLSSIALLAATSVCGRAQEQNPTHAAQHAFEPPALNDAISDDVRPMFDEIWREVLRLQESGQYDDARRIANELAVHVRQANHQILPLAGGDPELHFIGLYEGAHPEGPRAFQQHPQGIAEVNVTFTGQPLVLAFSAYEPIKWKVRLADGVQVKQVVLAGHSPQEIEGLPNDVEVIDKESEGNGRLFFSVFHREDRHAYAAAIGRLKEVTSLTPTTFQGAYQFQGAAIEIGEGNANWRNQLLAARLAPFHRAATQFERGEERRRMQGIRFQGVHYTETKSNLRSQFTADLAEFTPTGPIATTMRRLEPCVSHVAIDPKGPTYFAMRKRSVVRLNMEGGEDVAVPLPNVSWPCGLAFDTKRRRLLVANLSREGFLHAYEVDNDRWTLVGSLNHVDLQCIGYSEEADVIYGLQQEGGRIRNLITFSPDGKVLQTAKLETPRYAARLGPHGYFQLVGVGRHVALLTPPAPDLETAGFPLGCRCYLIDPTSGKTLYTQPSSPHVDSREFRTGDLGKIWERLLTEDDGQADLLIWQMAAGGSQSVEFLRERIEPLPMVDAERVATLIAQLDDVEFQTRQSAYRALAEMGDAAAEALAKAAENTSSSEVRAGLKRLLSTIESGKPSTSKARRDLRVVRVLSRCDAPEAVDYLEQLAKERRGATRSRAAEEALRRISTGSSDDQ